MYVKENVYIDGTEKIIETVQEANKKFHQVNEMLQLVSLKEFELQVGINKNLRKSEIKVSLIGIDEAVISLQCAINGLEGVLRILKGLPEMTAGLSGTLIQPPNV